MQQDLLPLFPLQLVLLPRTPLALHIFEERYKEMIGEAIDNRTEFGVVLASERGIVNTGCTALVDQVVERYDDGRMDIVVSGRRRFEILALDDRRAFLRGRVEFFDDDDDAEEVPDGLRAAALEPYERIRKSSADSDVLEPDTGSEQLSFHLAQVVSDLTFRQLLLVSRSETERLKQLAAYLPGLIRENLELARFRKLAGTNGHGRLPEGLK